MKLIWEFLNQLAYQYSGKSTVACRIDKQTRRVPSFVPRKLVNRVAFAWQCARMQKAYDSLLEDNSHQNYDKVFKKVAR